MTEIYRTKQLGKSFLQANSTNYYDDIVTLPYYKNKYLTHMHVFEIENVYLEYNELFICKLIDKCFALDYVKQLHICISVKWIMMSQNHRNQCRPFS